MIYHIFHISIFPVIITSVTFYLFEYSNNSTIDLVLFRADKFHSDLIWFLV